MANGDWALPPTLREQQLAQEVVRLRREVEQLREEMGKNKHPQYTPYNPHKPVRSWQSNKTDYKERGE